MRIGVDACCWSNKRGFGRFTRELLTAVLTEDRENEYLFFVDSHTADSLSLPSAAELVVVPTQVSPTVAASASGRRSVKDIWAFSREVMKHKLDLFFFPAVYSYFPVLNRAKVVVTIHDLIADNLPHAVFPNLRLKLFWKAKQQLAVYQSDLILTVSEYSKDQIVRHFNMPNKRVQAISEGPGSVFTTLPRSEEMDQALDRCLLSPHDRFLLYVGGISPHKNLEALVDAYNQLIRDANFADVKLVIVGDYKNDAFHSSYPALKCRIEQLQINDGVIFTGYVEDSVLAYLYNAASLMVLPSLEEGFGLPVVEAMACGTPVIASDRGSLPEILGDAGLTFDPSKPEIITEIMQAVLSDDSMRRNMKQKGYLRSMQFKWDVVAAKTVRIFAELVRG